MRALPTKQSSVLGLPIGRRRTDWALVGKLGAMGLGAVSTAAGGVAAKRAGGRLKEQVGEQAQKGKETMEKVGKAADRASSLAESVSGPVSMVSSVVGKLTGSSGDEGGGEKEGGGGDKNVKKLRLIVKEGIDVGVPIDVAYNQWTQFTELPSIMKAPQAVDQEEDDVTRWVAKIGPSRRRWTAKILEQQPEERIVWESTDGPENRGVVTFHQLDRNLTRVQVEMEYFPHGFVEKVGNIFLAARRRTRKDLRLFKHFLELAGSETGAWRGEIAPDREAEPEGEQAAQEDEEYAPTEQVEDYEPEDEEADEPEQRPASSRVQARRRAPGRPRKQRA